MSLFSFFPLFLSGLFKFKDLFSKIIDHIVNGLISLCLFFVYFHSKFLNLIWKLISGFFPACFKVVAEYSHGFCFDGFIFFFNGVYELFFDRLDFLYLFDYLLVRLFFDSDCFLFQTFSSFVDLLSCCSDLFLDRSNLKIYALKLFELLIYFRTEFLFGLAISQLQLK